MNDAVRNAIFRSLGLALDDEAWQNFGFRKRPKHGSLFNLFRPRWKCDLERRLMREHIAVAVAAHVAAGALPRDSISEAVEYLSGTYGSWRSLGYSTAVAGAHDLIQTIERYASAKPNEWGSICWDRLNVHAVASERAQSLLFLGCARLSIAATNWITQLKKCG